VVVEVGWGKKVEFVMWDDIKEKKKDDLFDYTYTYSNNNKTYFDNYNC
jgi:hypothetical protein